MYRWLRHRLRPEIAAFVVGMTICGTALAATSTASSALWFVLGLVAALAAVLAIAWRVLRERVAPMSTWVPYVSAVTVTLLAGLWLSSRWPWAGMVLALPIAGWGVYLVDRLARRMQRLLEERDHARAEAKRVQSNSERDALTGAYNRGAWRARLEKLVEETNETQRPLSVLFFDLDLFKLINDSLGHSVGDECLRAVTATVAAELRGGDVLGRMGGEEFAVALPGARRVNSIAVAERIRMAVQEHCRTVGEEVIELTVSIGTAEYLGEAEPLDALVDRADRSMYVAKDSGRNMVVADPAVPAGN